tara:strand:- start:915 stop:1217 length:303 start_codon:yes stop_codon:yes gene_type:complete
MKMINYQCDIDSKNPSVWVAYEIERALDSDNGVSETAFEAMWKVHDEMEDTPTKDYIEKILNATRATDGAFYLKDNFPFLFGKDFLANWENKQQKENNDE